MKRKNSFLNATCLSACIAFCVTAVIAGRTEKSLTMMLPADTFFDEGEGLTYEHYEGVEQECVVYVYTVIQNGTMGFAYSETRLEPAPEGWWLVDEDGHRGKRTACVYKADSYCTMTRCSAYDYMP